MYELVRKQNIAVKIVAAIVIMFAITQTIRSFTKHPKLNIHDELIITANEINKHTPVIIDSMTTLVNVNALLGNVFQYNYSLKAGKAVIDTTALKQGVKASLLQQLQTNTKAAYFKEHSIEVRANYVDETGLPICEIVVLPNEY